MNLSDLLATIGVTLLLIAFLLNLLKKIHTEHLLYAILNLFGAALCGISAYMVSFYPFVVLESVWAMVALFALAKHVPRETWKAGR